MQPVNLPCKFASPPRPSLFSSENKVHTPIQSVCHSATSELVSSFQPELIKGCVKLSFMETIGWAGDEDNEGKTFVTHPFYPCQEAATSWPVGTQGN